jgi:hypothetical protein
VEALLQTKFTLYIIYVPSGDFEAFPVLFLNSHFSCGNSVTGSGGIHSIGRSVFSDLKNKVECYEN